MATLTEMEMRFERLKKLYFSDLRPEVDDDGIEVPSCINRAQIIQQFENMGVELPLGPADSMRPLPPKKKQQ